MNVGQVFPGRFPTPSAETTVNYKQPTCSGDNLQFPSDNSEQPAVLTKSCKRTDSLQPSMCIMNSHREGNNSYHANQVKQHYNTSQVRSYNANLANGTITTLHPSGIPRTISQPDTLSDRPRVVPAYIPLPTVDAEVLRKQSDIFRNEWPQPSPIAWKENPQFCELYQDIKSFDLPNFLGARRSLQSGLNLERWEARLYKYHDRELCFFLRFGWPLGYHKAQPPESVPENHPSASHHLDHVQDFIREELTHKAIVGPFTSTPFLPWTRLSPLMTRPKKDSQKRRVIVDMSFPEGSAVNDGINISSIYGRDTTYTLPSITTLTTKLQTKGGPAWMWKADLSRAYRQLRIDPIETPLLGLSIDNRVYLDLCPSFGCRSSSGACQRVSAAVTYLMAQQGFVTYAFLDDYAGIEDTHEKAYKAYEYFIHLTSDLGLSLALDKCAPPSQTMQWLGYDVNSINMTLSIPRNKMLQFLAECQLWSAKVKASKSMIQSIVGKMIHVANCVQHARRFTSRILDTLRYMSAANQQWTTLDKDFKADVTWFLQYAQSGNGLSLLTPRTTCFYIECDSSLTGGGGNTSIAYYSWTYSQHHVQKYTAIHQLEAINLLVAYRTLCPPTGTQGQCIVMVTDNISSAYALSTGRTRDSVLAACARELWLEAARADHDIKIIHRHGELIPLADALSRVSSDQAKANLASKLVRSRNLIEILPRLSGYVFFDNNI